MPENGRYARRERGWDMDWRQESGGFPPSGGGELQANTRFQAASSLDAGRVHQAEKPQEISSRKLVAQRRRAIPPRIP